MKVLTYQFIHIDNWPSYLAIRLHYIFYLRSQVPVRDRVFSSNTPGEFSPRCSSRVQVKNMEEGWRLQLSANQKALAQATNQKQSLAAQATMSAVQVGGG